MSRSIEDARRVLDAQPFSRLVRAEMTQYTTQVVELRVPITEQIQQQHGFVHGGVVYDLVAVIQDRERRQTQLMVKAKAVQQPDGSTVNG